MRYTVFCYLFCIQSLEWARSHPKLWKKPHIRDTCQQSVLTQNTGLNIQRINGYNLLKQISASLAGLFLEGNSSVRKGLPYCQFGILFSSFCISTQTYNLIQRDNYQNWLVNYLVCALKCAVCPYLWFSEEALKKINKFL